MYICGNIIYISLNIKIIRKTGAWFLYKNEMQNYVLSSVKTYIKIFFQISFII